MFDEKDEDTKTENDDKSTSGKQEFMTSYFAWIPLDEQKTKVDRLENITNKNNKKSD